MDVDNIGLNAVQGRLLAGHEHQFTFTLATNGIILESIRVAARRDQPPVTSITSPDLAPGDRRILFPRLLVDIQQRPLLTTYDITVSFRLDWNMTCC